MDISAGAIHSYQTNQNLAGWARSQEVESQSSLSNNSTQSSEDALVSLSNQSRLIEWFAQSLPPSSSDTATILRTAHGLYEYGAIEINELNSLNDALNAQPNTHAIDALNRQLETTQSYSLRLSQQRILQVFLNLEAAHGVTQGNN